MANAAIHTVPAGTEWENKRAGSDDVLSRHGTQAAAVEAGRAQAMTEQAEHVIHGEDGAIRERNSYGNDPTSSKG